MAARRASGTTTTAALLSAACAEGRWPAVAAVDLTLPPGELANRLHVRSIPLFAVNEPRPQAPYCTRPAGTSGRVEVLSNLGVTAMPSRIVKSLLDGWSRVYPLIVLDLGAASTTFVFSDLLANVQQVVLPVAAAADAAHAAHRLLDWLQETGNERLVESAVVVIHELARRSASLTVGMEGVAPRVSKVAAIPWDPRLAGARPVDPRTLRNRTRRAYDDLASHITNGFSSRDPGLQRLEGNPQ